MTNPFSFKGSMDRSKYINTCIIAYAIVILSVIFILIPLFSCCVTKVVMYAFIIASQWAVIAASVRRLHDYGNPETRY
ncbi:MAG: DUF805 domain-containing protein [Acidobacteriota bacterium]